VLLLKGGSLLAGAESQRPELAWPWLAVVAALSSGGLKARLLFSKSRERNLARTNRLLAESTEPGYYERVRVLKGARVYDELRTGERAYLSAVLNKPG
jgi:hypothetical protein